MSRFLIVLVGLGALAATDCGDAVIPEDSVPQAPVNEASSGDAEDRFVGTWKLVSVERRATDGELLPPRSPDPIGFIIYDPAGYMGVTIMQSGRTPYAGDQPTPEEALAALTTYLSYFGTFTVNEADGFVTHHVQGSLNPRRISVDQKRFFEFSGNQLTLQPPVGPSGVTARLTWERVPDLPEAELTSTHRRLIGFYKIGSVERRTAAGELVPVNQYDSAFIIYTASGHMAVHLMRPGRPDADSQPTPEAALAAMRTYGSYFGPYSVNVDEGYFVHHRIGNLNPGSIGTDAQRFYELSDTRLVLRPPPTVVDGEQVQSALTWERLSQWEPRGP